MIDHQISEARAQLEAARASEAAMQAAQDQHLELIEECRVEVSAAQAALAGLTARTPAVQQDTASARRIVAEREEALLELLNVQLAAATLALHREDPIENNAAIVANVHSLRARVPDELNTPINKKFALHPLVSQALALLPPLPEFDRPVALIANWPSKRRSFIEFPTPPQAA